MRRFFTARRLVALLVVAAAMLTIGIMMSPRQLERILVYHPTSSLRSDPGDIGLGYRDVHLIAEDGVRLHGWFVPREGAWATALAFHGNGGNIGHRVEWIKLLHDAGVAVLIIDYRGYGRSEGAPFEDGLYRDARAAYRWWEKERRPLGDRLIIAGESLGGAVAVHLASEVSPDALVLQSTFTSIREMAKTMFPIGLLRPLMNVRFDSATLIRRVACPTLIIHGTRDTLVPFRMGQELFDLAPEPKAFYAVPDAAHNDLLDAAGPEYGRRLTAFFSRVIWSRSGS